MTKKKTSTLKVELVPIKNITVGERFREDIDLNQDFVASIEEKGILTPITLDTEYNLISGGRRLAGAREAKLKIIPALIREVSGELDLRECELLENTQRKDLGWIEQNKLVERINDLMQEKYGIKRGSQRKTAQILNRSVGGISRQIQLAKALKHFPKLAECASEDEAIKLLRKLTEKVEVQQMSEQHKERVAKIQSGEVKVDSEHVRLSAHAEFHYHIGDCFVEMGDMIKEGLEPPIGLVEVDPPYGIDLKNKKKGDTDRKLRKYEEVDSEEYAEWLILLCNLLYQVTPNKTRVIFWFGVEWYKEVKYALTSSGFSVDPIPNLWTKPSGQTNNPESFLARCYECFFSAWKGEGIPIRQRGRSNLFEFSPVSATRKYHPTQRPVDLMQEILRTFGWPGGIIMVPFLGSGSTLIAAYREEMKPFGWELNSENKEPFLAAVERDLLEEAVLSED